MIIYPRHFVRFLDGRAGTEVVVGFLPGELGAHIGTLETNVKIHIDYAQKIIKHSLYYEAFGEIQNTIDKGVCYKESKCELGFLYIKDELGPEIYLLVLKTTNLRHEVWLKSFYRVKQKQYAKKLKVQEIIRPQAEQEFMG